MKHDNDRTVCGAKTRQGTPCQRPPLDGKKRCRLHGGATPKGGAGRVTHGIYRRSLSAEEQEIWDSIQLGELDNELRLARVMLDRCFALHQKIREAPNDIDQDAGFELAEVRDSSENGRSVTSKRPDTMALIDRFLGRVAMLEKTRAELIAAQAERGGDDDTGPLPWVD